MVSLRKIQIFCTYHIYDHTGKYCKFVVCTLPVHIFFSSSNFIIFSLQCCVASSAFRLMYEFYQWIFMVNSQSSYYYILYFPHYHYSFLFLFLSWLTQATIYLTFLCSVNIQHGKIAKNQNQDWDCCSWRWI